MNKYANLKISAPMRQLLLTDWMSWFWQKTVVADKITPVNHYI